MTWIFTSDRPIYSQLVDQIQLKILSGEYKAGDRLMSIRDLSADAAVNPNTMQRALSELEQLGLVYTQRTSGRFITDDKEKIAQIRHNYAKKSIEDCVYQMKSLGYNTEDMVSLVKSIIEEESK